MYSADFLKKYAQLQQQQVNQAAANAINTTVDTGGSTDPVEAGQRMIGSRPSSYANTKPGVVEGVVYDTTSGKAYPNPSVAAAEGVTNFVYQIPAGMNIDWSYWDRFKQPASPSQKSVKPVGANHTTYYNPAPFSTSYRAPAYSQQEARPKNTSEKIAYEIEANRRSQAAGFASAAAQEIDANRRSIEAGFADAAAQEIDANKRSQAAGFADAAAQEIDANRRAQLDGFANAAEKEIWHRNNKAQRKSGLIN